MKTNNCVIQENGLELIPVYLCSKTAECASPRCKLLEMEDPCHHTLDKFYARNPDTVKLFDELTDRFNLTIYNQHNFKTGEIETKIIFEEK